MEPSTSTAVVLAAQAPALRPLARLTPQSSFVPAASALHALPSRRELLAVEPTRLRADHAALAFLDRIDRIEIHATRTRSGVTFYVLQVFLHRDSPRAIAALPPQPDYELERRFSDFYALRALVHDEVFFDPRIVSCAYCADFVVCMRFNVLQPRALLKLAPSTALRKRMLASFINEFVRLGKRRARQNARCMYHKTIAQHIEAFVRIDTTSI